MKSLQSYANPGNQLIRSLPVLNKIIIVMGILSMSIVIKPIEKKRSLIITALREECSFLVSTKGNLIYVVKARS